MIMDPHHVDLITKRGDLYLTVCACGWESKAFSVRSLNGDRERARYLAISAGRIHLALKAE